MRQRNVTGRTIAKLEAATRQRARGRRTVDWRTILSTAEAATGAELCRGMGLSRSALIRFLIAKEAAFHKHRRPNWGATPTE